MISLLAATLLPRPLPLRVEGNLLLDDKKIVILQGISIPGFDTSDEGRYVFRSARVALEDWHANCVRLPLCEDRWFEKTVPKKEKGQPYINGVEEVMNLAENRNGYLILSLSWTDAGQWGENLGPHSMPDDHAIQFWKDLAGRYKGDPHVLFDLYAAPQGVSPEVWRDGGQVKDGGLSYHTPGMQALLSTIRKAGAKNVCLVCGLPGDVSPDLKDPDGRGLIYEANSEPAVAALSAKAPVLLNEPTTFELITKYSLHWIAGSMAPDTQPSLIQDWIYTPTPWGAAVKKKLAGE